jgi:hypothetical protein
MQDVIFPQEGEYRFRLTVGDEGRTAFSLFVSREPGAE